jgi:hypothetical protein
MLQLKMSTFLMPSQTPSKVLKLENLKFAECLYTYLRGAYYPDFYFQQFFTAVKSNVSFLSYSFRRTLTEPLTMGKQLVNFITCGCESSAPFL